MSNIRSIDMLFLDDVFDRGGGYVLNFSDRIFAILCGTAQHRYRRPGPCSQRGSKAKRLRCFFQTVKKATVVRTLQTI
jgi:hypothetical protein